MTAKVRQPDVRDALTAGRATGAGALAALAGLVAAEVFALILPGRPSPVTAVADRLIAGAPDSVREWLIGTVGTLDKPLLVVGIVAVIVGGGAVVGRLCRRTPQRVPWIFLAAAVIGFVVAWDGMTADVAPLLLVVGVGTTVASLILHCHHGAMATPFDDDTYVSLRSYKQNGGPIDTPVWAAPLDGKLVIFTRRDSFKVKRIRRNPRVQVARCGVFGAVSGAWRDGSARIVEHPADEVRAYQALDAKYGWQMRLGTLLRRFVGGLEQRLILEIALDR